MRNKSCCGMHDRNWICFCNCFSNNFTALPISSEKFCDLKTFFITVSLIICLSSCKSNAKKVENKQQDSLISITPPPSLDPIEFSKYHNLVSDFIAHNL